MLILAEPADTPMRQLPQLAPVPIGTTGAGDDARVPRAATGVHNGGALPSIHGAHQQVLNAEVRQLEEQLRAKDANAHRLLGALGERKQHPSPSRQLPPFDSATLSVARGTGLQPAELAEAARIGLTPEDLEQLIEDLAAKEFHHLEQCVAATWQPIELRASFLTLPRCAG
jgi:hypothetical protein